MAQKLSLPVKDGYAEGAYNFAETAPGGLYKIRAYTNWMQNETESFFLQRTYAAKSNCAADTDETGFPGERVWPRQCCKC